MTDPLAGLRGLITEAEDKVADKQAALTASAADLARTVGPLATAHRLAELALEFAELAESEHRGYGGDP